MQHTLLVRIIHILFLVVLIFALLYVARAFLIPLTIAGVLAMLFMPFSRWLENGGFSRGIASLICVVCFILILATITLLLAWQISAITDDLTELKKNVSYGISQIQQYVSRTFGISQTKQNKMLDEEAISGSGVLSKAVTAIMGSLLNVGINLILTIVYMFLLLYSRSRLKKFILILVPESQKEKTKKIIAQSGRIVQQYLIGLATVVCLLWIMYGIGFSIVGIRSAWFFAVLCGLLEIVPFVGNLTGSTLTVLMAFSQGGGLGMALGVLLTYILIQGIQAYIISPLVLGAEVNVNPLFTIIILVAGQLLWGIPGMILAIPLLGITKIIFDNVEELRPYAYLIGHERKKKSHKGTALLQKVKTLFQR